LRTGDPAVLGLSTGRGLLRVHHTAPDPDAFRAWARAVIQAHDPAGQTPDQAADADADAARVSMLESIDSTLQTYALALDTWDDLTLDQLRALQRRQIQVQTFLLRWLRRQMNG
jgi:hypothetical protein